MFVTPAYAQGAAGPSGMDFVSSFIPIILLIAIFWFLIFRPQQKRMKAHNAMLAAVKRGDTIVTNGGIVGKVTKAVENEDLEVEIAAGMKVKVVRSMIADVRSKTEPVNDNKAVETKSANTKSSKAKGGRGRAAKAAPAETDTAAPEADSVEAEATETGAEKETK
ncbi:hypothetical protein GCM10011499_24250 [Pelagibacterium lentulum]|uniref:Sec translocon accessory complex subunit YajC n=1 Tax=Pelagibacterium lentulum TaxID=2029865 RepID=A0A916REI6_9HYPH|nr:hypothetical protein GCM10011499_24250 [Pelagibacterium lentulum]